MSGGDGRAESAGWARMQTQVRRSQRRLERALPLPVASAAARGQSLSLGGARWSLTVDAPWRVVHDGEVDFGWSTPDVGQRLEEVVGRAVTGVEFDEEEPVRGRIRCLVLDDGRRVEVFAEPFGRYGLAFSVPSRWFRR